MFQGNRLVGKISGPQGRVEVEAATLGSGPVRLRVIGLSQVPRTTSLPDRWTWILNK